jgi:lactoylglutathione lyase
LFFEGSSCNSRNYKFKIKDGNFFKVKLQQKKGKTLMFVHASIRTSNMDRSIEFYTKLLGLKVILRMEIKQTNAILAFLKDPEAEGATLELTSYLDQKKFIQADYEDRLFDHLAFEVEDMNKTIENMRNNGVTITDEPYRLSPKGSLLAFVEDPDGTLIELIQKT